MASTSGQMNGNTLNWSTYGYGRVYTNWQRTGVSESGNYSTIAWQTYVYFQSGETQLDNGWTNGGGVRRWTNTGRIHNYTGNFTTRSIKLASGSFNTTHDSNGNKTLNIASSLAFFNVGTSSGSSNWTLPQIYREISITSFSVGSATVTSFNVNVQTNRTADLVDYSINNGAWTRGYTGNFTNRTFTINNLNPGTTYSVKVRVRRADSGKYGYSGLKSITTTPVTITSVSAAAITDTSINISATVSHTADQFRYRLNGGAYEYSTVGDFTSKTVEVYDLVADQEYTIDVSAKHKTSQTWTSNASTTVTTESPKALQPINLAPAGGIAIQDLTPTLDWTYTSTSPDAQTAYQVIVTRQSDDVTIWDSGKVISSTSEAEIPIANELVFNVLYQWQVRTWSTYDVAGPYSEPVIFKTSQPPTATITSPVDESLISTDTPIITWDYSDPEGNPQISYTLEVIEIESTGMTTGTEIYTVTIPNTNDTSSVIPVDTLANGKLYAVRVIVTDSDNLVGESEWSEFSVGFIAPPAPNIEVELSADELFTRISVTSNKPNDDSFSTDAVKIYKREFNTGEDWQYVDTVQGAIRYIDDFEDETGWVASGVGTSVIASEITRQGNYSLSPIASGAGSAIYTKSSSVGAIENSDKIRMWVYTADTTLFSGIEVRFGADDSNYYSFTLLPANLTDLVWNSIEVDINLLDVTGAPSLGNINWEQIVITTTAPLIETDILFDGLSMVQTSDALFVYDYVLTTGKTYEYSAIATNTQEVLDSSRTVSDTVTVIYSEFTNTFLVPIGNETNSVVAYMSGDTLPEWTTRSSLEYLYPVGSPLPVVYSLGAQKYRKGTIRLLFLDGKLNCEAMEAAKGVEAIMQYKPILLRTWWGDNIYISIDGQVSLKQERLLGWSVEFDFTEVAI